MRLHPTLCFITHLLRGYSAPGSPARGRGSSRRGRARWPPKAELRPAVPGLQQGRAQGTNSAPLKIAAPGLLLSRGPPAGSGPLPQRGSMCGEVLRARCLPRGCQPCPRSLRLLEKSLVFPAPNRPLGPWGEGAGGARVPHRGAPPGTSRLALPGGLFWALPSGAGLQGTPAASGFCLPRRRPRAEEVLPRRERGEGEEWGGTRRFVAQVREPWLLVGCPPAPRGRREEAEGGRG